MRVDVCVLRRFDVRLPSSAAQFIRRGTRQTRELHVRCRSCYRRVWCVGWDWSPVLWGTRRGRRGGGGTIHVIFQLLVVHNMIGGQVLSASQVAGPIKHNVMMLGTRETFTKPQKCFDFKREQIVFKAICLIIYLLGLLQSSPYALKINCVHFQRDYNKTFGSRNTVHPRWGRSVLRGLDCSKTAINLWCPPIAPFTELE